MKNNPSFTLVEILITIAVISVATFGSFIAFNQFNKYQNLNVSYENLKHSLNIAKSNALAQVINKCNTSQKFVGHQIRIITTTNPDSYVLEEVCQNPPGILPAEPSYRIKETKLPSDVSISSGGNTILFLVLTGKVRGTSDISIILTNGTQNKEITIGISSGVIQ